MTRHASGPVARPHCLRAAPAAAAPLAPRCGGRPPGCWGWTRGRRSPSTTCHRRWPGCSTSWPHRRSGSVCVARAVQRGADRDAAEELLRRLVDTGVLVDAEGPERVARQRAAAAVIVVGGGRSRPGVAAGLALAGVGGVWVEAARRRRWCRRATSGPVCSTPTADGRPSRRSSTSSGGSRRGRASGRHRPGPRRTCACSPTPSSPNRRGSRHCTATGSRTCPSGCATAPGSSGRWCCPGRSACLAMRGAAPVRPRPRLAGRHGTARRATRPRQMRPRRRQPRRWGSPRCWRALDVAGGGGTAVPPVLGATLELDLATGELLRRPWPAHPDCACGAPPPAQTCGPRAGRGTIMR